MVEFNDRRHGGGWRENAPTPRYRTQGGNGLDNRTPTPRNKLDMMGHIGGDHGDRYIMQDSTVPMNVLRDHHDQLHADGADHEHPKRWNKKRPCPDCNGAGSVPGIATPFELCPTCKGRG